MSSEHDLERFREMQRRDYQKALSKIGNGRKESHWIRYIFPQVIDAFFGGRRDPETLGVLGIGS